MVVVAAVKRGLEGMHADTLRFPGIPMRFFDLPNHARVHMLFTPFIRRVIWKRGTAEDRADEVKVVAGQKQEQHPGTFARGAVRCSCGMLSPDPWARLRREWTLGLPPRRGCLRHDYSDGRRRWLVLNPGAP